MSSNTASQPIKGPPYAPTVAGVGGKSTVIPDIPILAILILFYAGAAVGNMSLFQINLRKGHKFLISGLLFGFSMARILTCSLRMASATHPHNVSLLIAATIFVNAGILIVYLVDLIFAQRILRARQPWLGWHPALRITFKVLYALLAVTLVLAITSIVLSFYTLDIKLKKVCRDIQLAAVTYLLVIAALPLVILSVTYGLPQASEAEKFGHGSINAKSVILAISSSLCTLGAGFKAGINWEPPRPMNNPAWYDSKSAFYIFLFVLEILVLYLFLAFRIDRRFHVPDGSGKRGRFTANPIESRLQTAGKGDRTSTEADTEKGNVAGRLISIPLAIHNRMADAYSGPWDDNFR